MATRTRYFLMLAAVLAGLIGFLALGSSATAEEAQTCEDQESEYCRPANCNWSCVYWLEDETRCEANCRRTQI